MDAKGAKEPAEKSGNSFQCGVLTDFRGMGWGTTLSPYYIDLTSDKTRETDIIAEMAFPVKHNLSSSRLPLTSIHLRLFIECKYVPAACNAPSLT